MDDIERDIVEGMQDFTDKLKRGDLIPATRMMVCPTCRGEHPEWCSGCAGCGVVCHPSYLNDWNGAGDAGV
jgi:hypothetical protein